MRAIAASVLVFEALVVALAIPVAITLSDTDPVAAIVGGGLVALACLVVAGMLRRPLGYQLGWGLQVVVVATGFVVPAMFFLGALFAVLWGVGLAVGRKGERIEAELRAQAEAADPGPGEGAPAG
ncbi:MAG: DUF4233 domain-containing protein [Actinomycetota bacterium]|nr:DUF4233 domain-containing protein [Actinomycetota bacterium]MDH4352446.1 DUF4233 domain-containing protein [Actinomycetota bacterium]MDH5277431.1 DUF4233 domain-containing protein [Actinomycetota bacterium]